MWLIAGMCIDVSIQLTLMLWRPSVSQHYVLYILATLWGVTDGIWQTQINSETNAVREFVQITWTFEF